MNSIIILPQSVVLKWEKGRVADFVFRRKWLLFDSVIVRMGKPTWKQPTKTWRKHWLVGKCAWNNGLDAGQKVCLRGKRTHGRMKEENHGRIRKVSDLPLQCMWQCGGGAGGRWRRAGLL
jgi:hypothetical protein